MTAQESVIAGLREERQLWGKELAHQGIAAAHIHTHTPFHPSHLHTLPGATLAQDRGRMEAQVEALLQEVKGLHQQTERDRDNLRIKEKVIFERMLKSRIHVTCCLHSILDAGGSE